MAFAWGLLGRRRWTGHLVEDAEFQMELLLREGIRVEYVPGARLEAEMPVTLDASSSQNERWERGRIDLARRYVPELLRTIRAAPAGRRVAYADAIVDHLVPPLSVVVLLQGVGLALLAPPAALGSRRARAGAIAHMAAITAVVVHVAVALRSVNAPGSVWRSLTDVPKIILWKARLWVRALAPSNEVAWQRTQRNAERVIAPTAAGAGAGAVRPPALMFGVPIDDLTMAETLQLVEALVEHGRKHGTNHQLATVNVDFLVNALADERTMQILQFADACIPDGMPVVWGCRALGMPLRERVAGADLVPLLIEQSRRTGWHVHVFGSTPEVARAATALLEQRYPGSRFSIDPGPMIPHVDQVDDATLDAIAAVDADILCVALGNPKQERFIQAHRDRLRVPVMIGVGGSLDMLVGKRRRAPAWVQRIGMEWIVRAAQEPHRLGRRYAHDIRVFGPTFVRHWRGTAPASATPGFSSPPRPIRSRPPSAATLSPITTSGQLPPVACWPAAAS